jgi:hypothetical protein
MGNIADRAPEDQTVRQYRFLLRTAPLDALEAVHADALAGLSAADREVVLSAVQEGLVAGARLSSSDIAKIAHLLTLGERRTPGAFLRAVAPGPLQALAQAVTESEAASGLLGGYDAWDGVDPEPADVGEDHGGTGADEALGVQVNTAKEWARMHAAQTGVGASGGGF